MPVVRAREWKRVCLVWVLSTFAGLMGWGGPARAQMIFGERMEDFEKVFGVKVRQARYDYDAALPECSAPARVLHPGEQAAFTLQLINNTDAPIRGDFFVEALGYGTRGVAGDIWKPVVYKTRDAGRIPISVDLPGKDSHQNLVLSPRTPELFGAYALVVDLGAHGRRFAGSYVRTAAPVFVQGRLPQLCLDVEDPDTLRRLGGAPNRMGIPFFIPGEPGAEAARAEVVRRLAKYREAGLPITVEFGAGPGGGAAQPLGRVRPHLDDDGVMLETKSDYAWLPGHDADFRAYVRDLCAEFGWPKGPINGVMLWNEPWEGISISGWGADMPRYREMYRAMAEGVEDARRDAGVNVLIGGCDSDSNTFDKLFGDGSDEFLKWLDFCSIHYQGMNPPSLYKFWRERESPNGRVLIWDTESWVANTDDRVAAVVATNLSTGHDRAVGIFHGNIVTFADRPYYGADGRRTRIRQQDTWSVAAAVGAANRFIGPRPFRELLFQNGLPWVMRFADPPAGVRTEGAAAPPPAGEDGMLVVVGDIGEAFGADNVLFRSARGTAELAGKAELAARLADLAAAADAGAAGESRALFDQGLEEWNRRVPLSGARMLLDDPENRFRLYDFHGNAVAADNGRLTVPLDHRGFYLAGDGRAGSFDRLLAAARGARVEGIEPLAKEALDFSAPIGSRPELRLRLTNVLNRPVRGDLRVTVAGLTFEAAEREVGFAPGETRVEAFRVAGGEPAPDNAYPLAMVFDAGADGASRHFETLRVNYIQRRSVTVDGELGDWEGILPQTVAAGGSGPTLAERAWEPYRAFEGAVEKGYAAGYLAYDDENFYFAAKIADHTPHPGTLRVASRDDDSFYYPAVSREIAPGKTLARRLSVRDNPVTAAHGLRLPGGAGAEGKRATGAWEAISRHWAMDFRIPAGERRRLALYLLDHDPDMRAVAPITVTDSAGGRELDKRTLDKFGNGVYAVYEISGNVRVTISSGRDWLKSGVHGVFLDAAPGETDAAAPAPAEGARARFLERDDATGGDWEGRYGAAGHALAGGPEKAWSGGVEVVVPHAVAQIEHRWPEGVRRYSYRKRPVLPAGNAPYFDNVQLAFNALGEDEKTTIPHLPGVMPKFTGYHDTDYEYALNTVAPEYGGGVEVLRLRYPGMARKHYYPRQGASPNEGEAPGARLAVKRDNGLRRVECALPWAEIPAVKARLDAGAPVKFTFRVNDDGGAGLCMELSRGRSVAKRNASFKADWVEHWANELEFAWEK